MPDERTKWWSEARFGMFLHWGLPTLLKRGIWVQYWEHIPRDEYAALIHQFDPKSFKPAEWVALARDAGMKYIVLTTRNHDGFCLFDTKTTDFNVTNSPAGRDLLAEYAEACHSAGMKMGFYYSLMNWRHPGCLQRHVEDCKEPEFYRALVDETHEQVRELCTNYGQVDVLWWDCMHPPGNEIWRSEDLDQMVRGLQPGVLTNNRAGTPGDFGTPENEINAESRPWEACMTMNDTWGYAPNDRNWKTPRQLVVNLMTCAAKGGNLLLNASPDPDGRLQPEAVERLRTIGSWMQNNDTAIYGTSTAPIGHSLNALGPGQGWATMRGNKIYMGISRWQGSTLAFGWLKNRVLSARVLGTDYSARIEQQGDRVWLHDLPEYPPDPVLPVIEIEVDGAPERIEPQKEMLL